MNNIKYTKNKRQIDVLIYKQQHINNLMSIIRGITNAVLGTTINDRPDFPHLGMYWIADSPENVEYATKYDKLLDKWFELEKQIRSKMV